MFPSLARLAARVAADGSAAEVAERRAVPAVVSLVVLSAAVAGIYLTLFSSVFLPPASGILDVARNLAEGRGLVSHDIIPAFLPYHRYSQAPVPYLWYPLLPMLTAALFVVFGMRPWLMLVPPVLSYALAGLALFLLGRRLFGVATGFAAAAFLLVQPIMIDTSFNSSFSDPILVSLLVAAVLCMFKAADGRRVARWLALAGVAVGVAQYARSAGMMMYVPMVVLALMSFPERRLARLAAFLLPCLAVQVPLFAWNLKTVGTPTFTPTYLLLWLTASFPGFSSITQLVPTSLGTVIGLYGPEIVKKWIGQVWVHYKYFLTLANPVVLVGAVLSLSLRLDGPQARFRIFTVVLYVALVFQNSLVIWDNRYLFPAVPFLVLLGCEFLRRVVVSLPPRRLLRIAAVSLLALLVSTEAVDLLYQSLKRREQHLRMLVTERDFARKVSERLPAGAVLMAISPGTLTWDSDHAVIQLPTDFATAERIYREYIPFEAIVLPVTMTPGGFYNYSPDWVDLVAGRKRFLGFERDGEIVLSSGERLVLLTDARRRRAEPRLDSRIVRPASVTEWRDRH